MRYIFVILSVFLLTSCLSYRVQTRQPQLRTVLGVTIEGDTIQVPMNYFENRLDSRYNYDIEYFFWRDSWWLYNQNLYNRWWWTNQPYWRPRPNHIIIPRQQPNRVQVPREPQRRTPQVQPNRGRSNQTRQPQYVRPSNTRTQTTPNVIKRSSTPNRSTTPTRSNNQSRTTSGGRVIKQ